MSISKEDFIEERQEVYWREKLYLAYEEEMQFENLKRDVYEGDKYVSHSSLITRKSPTFVNTKWTTKDAGKHKRKGNRKARRS